MSQFIQLHLLTMYPPSNLNRDDLGRPKTAIVGGTERLRVSSQSLKRAWRSSDVFVQEVSSGMNLPPMGFYDRDIAENTSIRSKKFGEKWIKSLLEEEGLDEARAELWSKDITRAFGVAEKEKNELSQLVQLSAGELLGCRDYCLKLSKELIAPQIEATEFLEIETLQEKRSKKKKADDIKKLDEQIGNAIRPHVLGLGKAAVDIALFGRMLASSPAYNVEAAAQISHAFTVNPVKIEDDFFTAVDDLNTHEEDAGAGHMGDAGFGSGVFYTYCCINKELLGSNLQNDDALAKQALSALVQSAATVSPTGKQNSFASRAHTSYLLAEKGSQQPRSLSVAFLKASRDTDPMATAIKNLEKQQTSFNNAYGACADAYKVMNVETGEGSLAEIIQFVTE